MSKLRVHCFGVSLDGFGAGPNQSLNDPLGVGGEDLHQWFFPTRAFQKMQGKSGGTTFHFVTDGIHAALQSAREAAGGLDVRLGGGPATVRQYLQAGLIDELHVAVSPIILGGGENLFARIDLLKLGYQCTEHVVSPAALHAVLRKKSN